MIAKTGSALRWAEFRVQAPHLGREIAAIVDQFGFVLLGTIRADGMPRISPVETHLVGNDIALVLIPKTRKAADIRRDNRVTLQSPIRHVKSVSS